MRLTPGNIPDLKQGIHRDHQIPGLFVEVGQRARSFKIQASLYKPTGREDVRMTLGRYPALQLGGARKMAIDLLERIKAGEDPRVVTKAATVQDMMDKTVARMEQDGCSPVHIANTKRIFNKHLADWLPLPLASIKRADCEARYEKVWKKNGKSAAHHVRIAFNAAWNTVSEDRSPMQKRIVVTVPAKPSAQKAGRALLETELKDWWAKVNESVSPLVKHRLLLQLLGGLRPGACARIEREWIDLPNHAVKFARTKAGGEWHMPLSPQMEQLLKQALALSEEFYPDSPCLFTADRVAPSAKPDRLKHADFTRGHDLRRTWISIATTIVPETLRLRMEDHSLKGVQRVYVQDPVLFPAMVREQERMSVHLLSLLGLAGVEELT